jgi:cobalamin biosynthesis protein CobT
MRTPTRSPGIGPLSEQGLSPAYGPLGVPGRARAGGTPIARDHLFANSPANSPADAHATLGRIARVLTGRYGVTVAFDKSGPRVERERIVLPEIDPADARDMSVLTGYVDLLVARFRFSTIDEIAALQSSVTQRIAQVIEDRRVCEQLFRDYPGARGFIGRLREHEAQGLRVRWNTLPWREKLIWLIGRALWDEAPTATEKSDSLIATLGALRETIERAASSRSTQDSVAASKALVARVRSLAGGDENTMMFTADADETLDAEHVRGDPDSSDTTPPLESTDAASSDAASAGQAPSDATAQASESSAAAELATFDLIDGRPRRSIPLTTEFDRITDLTGQGDPAAWRNLRALARAETAPLTARLERALKADELAHWKREQERGEIDRPALAKLATSPGYRTPFRVKRKIEGRDAAVTILIDRSGSMAGPKIVLARLCATALCDALMQLSFKCEVLGYSSVESAEMRAFYEHETAKRGDLSHFNRRLERLDFEVYKRFGSNNPTALGLIECAHENPDGEALTWAAGRLAEQRAGRRILMVLSDGYPATGDGHPVILRTDLKARIEEIEGMGIDLIGIGLLDDAVENFYAHNIVVRKLDELPALAFSVLSDMLLKRQRAR